MEINNLLDLNKIQILYIKLMKMQLKQIFIVEWLYYKIIFDVNL